MAVQIVMPRLSDSMEEGTILSWLAVEGDEVQEGQPLVEIETDKATVTYDAESSGVILALCVSDGATVPVGAPIAVIGESGERLPRASAEEQPASRAHREPAGAMAADGPRAPRAGGPAAPRAGGPAAPRPGGPAARRAGGPEAPRVGGPGSPGAAATRGRTAGSRAFGRPKASPLARRIAAERGIELAGLTGSGPDGRVIRADVERASAQANGGASATEQWARPAAASEGADSSKGSADRHELTRLQQTIARRMAQSRATVPDIELRAEVDMAEAVELRERLRDLADPAPSINDFIIKAAALALREFPRVNGSYVESGTIETYSRVNVGFAVAGDDALLVPTIFDADRKPLGEIAASARTLAGRARDGSIAPSELSGGTFTVSNLGMYGVDSFSAVINPPQAAILAVGSLKPRAVVDASGELVARPTVVLTLACDHRILYGADGARFLSRVRELLERPHALLL